MVVVVILLTALGSWVYFGFFRDFSNSPSSFDSLEEKYSNSKYKFFLKFPEGFQVREIVSEDTDTILIENKRGEGIQILISPFDDIRSLTRDMIRKDLPELKTMNEQPITIEKVYQGLAFESDNPTFDGASQEIWFVFRGNLYQLSTYERFSSLLKSIFATRTFTQ